MIAKPRFSKLTLVRIAVVVVAVSLLSLHYRFEIEILGVLSWFVPAGYLLMFEIPRASRKQDKPER